MKLFWTMIIQSIARHFLPEDLLSLVMHLWWFSFVCNFRRRVFFCFSPHMFFAINAKRSRAWLSSAFYLRIEEKKIIKTFNAKGLSTLQLRTIHRRDQLLRSHILVVSYLYMDLCMNFPWILYVTSSSEGIC